MPAVSPMASGASFSNQTHRERENATVKKYDVSLEMPGFTSFVHLQEELSDDFLGGFNDTSLAEGTFPDGVNRIVRASVSGDSDDIEDGEAKVFVSVTLNVSAGTKKEAERIALGARGLFATLADILAEQADGGDILELDECEPDVMDIEEVTAA